MTNDDLGVSCWIATFQPKSRPPLRADISVDVCVIGAGIAGLSVAYQLAKQGRTVAVLDDGPVSGGMSAFTTAHLVNALDDRYFTLERLHGEEGSRLAAASHTAAIDTIEATVNEEGIACDFRRVDGYLFEPPGGDPAIIERERDAVLRAGIDAVELVQRAPIDGFDTGLSLRFPRQGQFHPLKYLNGLVAAIEARGGRVFCDSHAASITGGKGACVKTREGSTVHAAALVVATNVPVNDRLAIHTKQAPYTTYVVGLAIDRGSVAPALYWDTRQSVDEPEDGSGAYHYVRLMASDWGHPAQDVLIVGGEDHKTGQADDQEERFSRLVQWSRERWPAANRVLFRWSGQIMEPNDGVAFIGRNPMDHDNVYVVTGDSGNGMTHGTVAGLLITDLIQGRANPWHDLYDPGRITLRAAGEFAKENANVAVQYAKGYAGKDDVADVSTLLPGQGAVVRRGLKRAAIYVDEHGQQHALSAVCPHLGCVVAWNAVESTWDCPCHGSRFDCNGKVINGPANRDLSAFDD
jgi:glycine/D-amino acid oxidase-like deaminating enzyme/nitrite reductase/ring-hydroxylating ferredoxin subunit